MPDRGACAVRGNDGKAAHPQGRGPRRRRHGRADRRAPRQRQREADPLRPAGQGGQGQVGDRAQGDRRPREARAQPARDEVASSRRSRPPTTTSTSSCSTECDLVIEAISERMDWKKDLFAKVAPHIAPHAIFASNTSGLSITELSKTLPADLRKRFCGIHFFNPPRYMRLVELVPTAETDPRGDGPAGDVPHHHARQGRDPRQGHAQLRRQPRGRLLDAGDDAPHAAVQARLRRGRRADGPCDRAREERHLPHRRRRGPRHHGARHQDDGRHAARRSVARVLPGAGVARGAGRQGRAGPEDQGGHLHQEGQGHPGAGPRASRTTAPSAGDGRRRGAGDPQGEEPRRAAREAARQRPTRRRSSSGRSSATSSTTSPCTWATSPTTRATWTSPSAGASAGRAARSSCGRPRAGSRWRSGSRRTSTPARPWPRRRCPSG